MQKRMVETLIGFAVLALTAMLVVYAWTMQGGGQEGYKLKAYVEQVGGLKEGAQVCIGGVKVGSVESITLSADRNFAACVMLCLHDSELRLPSDTKMTIDSASLLGGKYVSLVPGMDGDFLEPGGTIHFVTGSVSFENLLIGAFSKKA